MHAKLPTRRHDDAVGDISDMYGACDLACYYERRAYGAEVEGSEGRVCFRWGAEVDDAVGEVGHCWRTCFVRR